MLYKKILLVDDDEDDRLLFIDAVNEINDNWQCETVANGMDALTLLRSQVLLPDIIFLDLNMAKMNGYECLSEIRSDSRFRDIPVVIFTTSRIQAEKDKTLRMGANYFFSKPGDYSVLKNELNKILELDFKV